MSCVNATVGVSSTGLRSWSSGPDTDICWVAVGRRAGKRSGSRGAQILLGCSDVTKLQNAGGRRRGGPGGRTGSYAMYRPDLFLLMNVGCKAQSGRRRLKRRDRPLSARISFEALQDVRKDFESCGSEGAAKGGNSRHPMLALRAAALLAGLVMRASMPVQFSQDSQLSQLYEIASETPPKGFRMSPSIR